MLDNCGPSVMVGLDSGCPLLGVSTVCMLGYVYVVGGAGLTD